MRRRRSVNLVARNRPGSKDTPPGVGRWAPFAPLWWNRSAVARRTPGWAGPEASFRELVAEMVREDLKAAGAMPLSNTMVIRLATTGPDRDDRFLAWR